MIDQPPQHIPSIAAPAIMPQQSWKQAATSALDATAAAIPVALGGVTIVYINFPAQYLSYGVFATILLLMLIHTVSSLSARPMTFGARLFEATALSAMLQQFVLYLPAWGLAAKPELLLALMCVVGMIASVINALLFLTGADKYARLIPAPVYSGFAIGTAILLLFSQSKILWNMWQNGSSSIMLLSICAVAIATNLIVRTYFARLPASAMALVAGACVGAIWVALGKPLDMVMVPGQALQLPWTVADFTALTAPTVKLNAMVPSLLYNGALLGFMVFINMTVANEGISQLDDRYATRWQHAAVALAGGVGAGLGAVPVAASLQTTQIAMRTSPMSYRTVLCIAIVCGSVLGLGLLQWAALAALAGAMLIESYFMADIVALKQGLRWIKGRALTVGQKEDLVLAATVTITAIVFNMIAAVMAGLLFGLLLFARRNAKKPVRFEWTGAQLHSNCARSRTELEILQQHGDKIKVLELEAELFFGAVASLDRSLQLVLQNAHTVVVDWSRVRNVDSSIALSLKRAHRAANALNIRILHAGATLQQGYAASFLAQHLPAAIIAPDLDRALEIAENAIIHSSAENNPESATKLQDALTILKGLSPAQRKKIETAMPKRRYKSGDTVFAAGDESHEMLIILYGSAGIIVRAEHGRDIRLTSLRRGAVVGEVGFLDNTARSATVVAQEDLSVYVLSRETHDALCISDAEIMRQIMQNLTLDLAVRLRHTNKLALARAEV